jgi:4-amino-4-deoxy-L-arabinose transferase-like glycosyltransferase
MKKNDAKGAGWFRNNLFPILLGATFILFILLRLRYLSTTLNWDEARFTYIVRALAFSDTSAPFHSSIYIHPPLYLILSRFGMAVWGESATLYRLISLAFASGSFFVLYFLVRDVSGRTAAVFACLALALLPAASSIDVWIKEDSLCVFWALCTLLAFVRRRYIWSGILLGFCLLSKENGILLLLILPPYLLLLREKKDAWRGLVTTAAIAAVISFWWYIFLSKTGGTWLDFFRGSDLNSQVWHFPWHSYITNTVIDLGWPLLLLAIWGGIRSVTAYFRHEDRRVILPVVWVLVFYLFISISFGKPFWMITLALPAWAWLAGLGLEGMYEFFAARGRALAVFAVAAALVAMLGVVFHLGGSNYIERRGYGYYMYSDTSRRVAEMLNRELPEGGTLISYESGGLPNTIISYYLRPDIRFVPVPWEYVDPERLGDLLGLWSGEGANAGFFHLDETGMWLASVYHLYIKSELKTTPYGNILTTER